MPLPVGLTSEWQIINVHPILTTVFKSISRTFEAEIPKIFKNIQTQPKILDVLIKKSVLACCCEKAGSLVGFTF